MKTKEELNALKAEVEALNRRLSELSGDELEQVTGGGTIPLPLSPQFWQSWNPGFSADNSGLQGFVDSDDYYNKITFE